jgi:Mannitol repressor
LRPLKQAITTKFVRIGNDYLESIFSDGGNGPLSTFSAKIKLAYALGIVSAETRLQIERVREVRNHFAHHKDKVSFKHPSVMSVRDFFKQKKSLTEDERKLISKRLTPKFMYVQTCFFVSLDLKNYIKRLGSADPIKLPIDCF